MKTSLVVISTAISESNSTLPTVQEQRTVFKFPQGFETSDNDLLKLHDSLGTYHLQSQFLMSLNDAKRKYLLNELQCRALNKEALVGSLVKPRFKKDGINLRDGASYVITYFGIALVIAQEANSVVRSLMLLPPYEPRGFSQTIYFAKASSYDLCEL